MIEVFVNIELVMKCHAKAVATVNNNTSKGYQDRYSLGQQGRASNIATSLMGYIAEAAVCIYLGLDPVDELTWRTERPDGGYDIRLSPSDAFARASTIDVKASENPYAARLMWPVKKVDKLAQAADIFVMTRVPRAKASREGQHVELCGWVTRDEFISSHDKAKGINGIVDGTPFMNVISLYSMEQIMQHLGHIEATKEKQNA